MSRRVRVDGIFMGKTPEKNGERRALNGERRSVSATCDQPEQPANVYLGADAIRIGVCQEK